MSICFKNFEILVQKYKNFVLNIKTMRPLFSQFSETMKWKHVTFYRTDHIKQFTTNVPCLIKYTSDNEWTDKTFSDRIIKNLKDPKFLLKGLYNFAGEFGKLYEEKKEDFFLKHRQFQCQDPDDLIEMLFTFDTEHQLEKFMVVTDSSHYGGYSSACLKITPAKTGLFSGNICSELLKDGEAKFAGYASMLTRKKLKSFKRIKYYDLSYYSHLVFKVRGDGRTYYINFSVPGGYETQNWVFSYPLFTRGGPYWQISKIPFSDFFFISNGRMADHQPPKVLLNKITSMGLTVRQVDGPFKLEIDYIGLELNKLHRQISPYEQYA